MTETLSVPVSIAIGFITIVVGIAMIMALGYVLISLKVRMPDLAGLTVGCLFAVGVLSAALVLGLDRWVK